MKDNLKPIARVDLLAREIEGEFVLLDLKTNQIHQLNPTASLIWSHCDGTHSINEIASIVVHNFSVSENIALNDVIVIVEGFKDKNLLND